MPIVRAGRVLGVLVVQNRTRRHYDEEEIETLQTIAMVLAELIAAGHFVSPNEVQQVDGLGLLPLRVDGVQLTPGVAIGRAASRPRYQPGVIVRTTGRATGAALPAQTNEPVRRGSASQALTICVTRPTVITGIELLQMAAKMVRNPAGACRRSAPRGHVGDGRTSA